MTIDFEYLRRIDTLAPTNIAMLLRELTFVRMQEKLFTVIESMNEEIDFDVADMREVHIATALEGSLVGLTVLDLACGSAEEYVLDDTFRNRYPPLLAELLTSLGAAVTGIDIRPHRKAHYTHLVRDLTDTSWPEGLTLFDIVACISLFNAPQSVFEHDLSACSRLLQQCTDVLKPDGVLITTLPDQLQLEQSIPADRAAIAAQYLSKNGYTLLYIGKGMAWARKMNEEARIMNQK